MNLLLEPPASVPYFTDVGATLQALGIQAAEFDWYVSDIETNIFPDGFAPVDGWRTGQELETLLSHEGLQFIWGVFSAFPRGTRFEVTEPPIADGDARYWQAAVELGRS